MRQCSQFSSLPPAILELLPNVQKNYQILSLYYSIAHARPLRKKGRKDVLNSLFTPLFKKKFFPAKNFLKRVKRIVDADFWMKKKTIKNFFDRVV